jgi:signal transduction histidine kinase
MAPSLISCPQCSQPIDPSTRICTHCGVNLALAALLAERRLTSGTQIGKDIPISPEILIPRLGNYLIERGVLRKEELQDTLEYQKRMEAQGEPRLIGQALVELGHVSRESLDKAITEQIFQLQSALHQSNKDLEKRVSERTSELQNALNRLSELNQLKSNFIANISHELRTPLTHLKGYIELIIDEGLGPLTKEQVDALVVMRRSEERLEKLIEDLIQFSFVARGDLDVKMEAIDLENVITEVVLLLTQKSENAKVVFKTSFPAKFSIVKADKQKLSWVLSQLLDNAIKFTPQGGMVHFIIQSDDLWVNFIVHDTGIGIAKDRIQEIFEPFHQLDSSATRQYGGTGLGLAMVRQIVEAHGSSVKVRSVEGKGSYFEFSLPVVKI